jgi:hypothetical protein
LPLTWPRNAASPRARCGIGTRASASTASRRSPIACAPTKASRASFKKYPVAAEFAQNKFLNEQLSVELTHDALRREWPNLYNHGSQPPSYTTLRVYLNSLPRAVRVMAREGEKAFNNNLRPFGIRDYNKLTANQLWVSDHMRHDVFVRNDLNLPGLEARRRCASGSPHSWTRARARSPAWPGA